MQGHRVAARENRRVNSAQSFEPGDVVVADSRSLFRLVPPDFGPHDSEFGLGRLFGFEAVVGHLGLEPVQAVSSDPALLAAKDRLWAHLPDGSGLDVVVADARVGRPAAVEALWWALLIAKSWVNCD